MQKLYKCECGLETNDYIEWKKCECISLDIIAKERAVEIFERHFNAEKFLMDNESAKNAALVSIGLLLEHLTYLGFSTDSFDYRLNKLVKQKIKEI